MDEVGSDELGKEGGEDVGEENDTGWEIAHQVLGGGQNYYVENIVDQAWKFDFMSVSAREEA